MSPSERRPTELAPGEGELLTLDPSGEAVSDELEALLAASHDALVKGTPLPNADDDSLRGELHELQQCLQLLSRAKRQRWYAPDAATADDGAAPAAESPPASAAAQAGLLPQRVARFEILKELGRGGHGVVLLARDPALRRLVALKIARLEVVFSAELSRRFLREATATASLRHPHVQEIYEVGSDGPLQYLAAAYCAGPTLQQWLQGGGMQATDREAAALVAALARGVHHAHQAGVLHRDIKPSNVLLDDCGAHVGDGPHANASPAWRPLGQYVPKLCDFGLAKLADALDAETRTGAVLGTPGYMAPEQTCGRLDEIGPATDVYALGVLLYEALAGRVPLKGVNDVDTARRVCDEPPLPPRRWRPEIAADLEAVCLRCLEKSPPRRYASAAALADDLDRFVAGEPTQARPLGRLATAGRWARRYPRTALLAGLAATLVLALAGGGWWATAVNSAALRRETELRDAAQRSAAAAEATAAEHRALLYASDLRVAQQLWEQGQLAEARALLATHIPESGQTDLREFAWRYLWRQTVPTLQTWRGYPAGVRRAATTRGFDRLLIVDGDDRLELWELPSRTRQRTLHGVRDAVFSDDGRRVAVAKVDGQVAVRDIATWQEVARFPAPYDDLLRICLSPYETSEREERLAVVGQREVRVYAVATGALVRTLEEPQGPIADVAFADYNATLLVANGGVAAWKLATGERREVWPAEGAAATCLAVSRRDGDWWATGYGDGRVVVRSLSGAGQATTTVRHSAAVRSLAFDYSNRRLAVAGDDQVVSIWSLENQQCLREFRGHVGAVHSAQFSADGSRLLTASDDGSVKLCELSEPYAALLDGWEHFYVSDAAFSGDSAMLAWCGHAMQGTAPYAAGRVDLDTLASNPLVERPGGHSRLHQLEFLAASRRFRAVQTDGAALDSECDGPTPFIEYRFRPSAVQGRDHRPLLAALPDGSLSVTGGRYPLALEYDQQDRPAEWLGADRDEGVTALALEPTARRLAVAAHGGLLTVWDLATRRPLGQWKNPTPVHDVAFFTPDELLTAGDDGVIRLVQTTTGRSLGTLRNPSGAVTAIALDPQRRTLAAGHADGSVSLWDLRTRRRLLELAAHDGKVTRATFSPDGTQLATCSYAGEVFLWRTPPLEESPERPTLARPASIDVGFQPSSSRAQRTALAARPASLPATVPPELDHVDERYRRLRDYADAHGYGAALPTFVDRETDAGVLIGAVAIRAGRCQWQDVPVDQLRAQAVGPWDDRWLGAAEKAFGWGRAHGHRLALRDFHQRMDTQLKTVVLGVGIVAPEVVEFATIPLDDPQAAQSLPQRLRLICRAAEQRGFAGGTPAFLSVEAAAESMDVAFFRRDFAWPLEIPSEALDR